ncbi:right-handed parallel beta-helix repeat-containing protein [Patescibacteria group bacterium]|nr:right-handed parallel beta-helix repeat-containing protein [Patescibacteria group bacterium]MBU1673100.1 right-handed parallel beta-helix repeat-containing protein [Patescibacteria group bacterium]MBU1963652.1 right-handed parallel beta-helix repeat-containing protein [Patescibacteria group bacterium]
MEKFMENWCKKMMNKFYDKQTNPIAKFLLFIPLLFYCVLETMAQAVAMTLFPSQKSFARVASTSKKGTFTKSYSQHKNYKSGLRYYATGGFMVLLASAFILLLVTAHIFPITQLSAPAQAASWNVTNTNDAGPGSLRDIINVVNGAGPGPHTINITVAGTLTLASDLPAINNNDVTITAAGAPGRFNIDANSTNLYGLRIWTGASNAIIEGGPSKNLAIGNASQAGIYIYNASTTITNIFIGTFDGNNPSPNTFGIRTGDGPGLTNLTVENCVISGNGNGLYSNLDGAQVVKGNYIGVNKGGIAALPNTGYGVSIGGGASFTTFEDNVLSNNGTQGASIYSASIIRRNKIGTDVNGTIAMGNGSTGLLVANNATVGGPSRGFSKALNQDSNLISNNGGNGAAINLNATNIQVQNNYIGTDINGLNNLGNSGNGIYVYNNSNNVEINDNYINNNTVYGLLVASGSTFVNVHDNLIGVDSAGLSGGNGQVGVYFLNSTTGDITDNTISNNGTKGIYLNSPTALNIKGNYIGTNPGGTAMQGNGQEGIYAINCGNCDIGGPLAGDPNIISGNSWNGIYGNGGTFLVRHNYIGTDVTGELDFGNGQGGVNGRGIEIDNGFLNAGGNVISGNRQEGVRLINGTAFSGIAGNFIGTDKDGDTAIANGDNGVRMTNTDDFSIKDNVISGNALDGVNIDGGSRLMVVSNKFGTNDAGTAAIPNGDDGLDFHNQTDATIGFDPAFLPPAAGDANVFSGNGDAGIQIASGTNNQVANNFIGTDITGTNAIPNSGAGIFNVISNGTIIGGIDANYRNIISGNTQQGFLVNLGNDITAENNYIGVQSDGTTPLANGIAGVMMAGTCNNGVIKDNVIANNGFYGIYLLDAASATPQRITIGENSIYNHAILGIELDAGANENIEAPVISNIVHNPGPDTYDVTVSTPYSGAIVELFTDAGGEGKNYKGNKITASDVVFNGITLDTGDDFTATVTNTNGSTSKFGGKDVTPPTVVAIPGGGTYLIPLTVTLDATDDYDPNPIIYYTTDGSNPTTSSDSYVKTCDVDVNDDMTIKFMGIDAIGNISGITTEDYIISSNPSGKTFKIGVPIAKNVGATTAEIYWTSNKLANSRVNYGKTVAYGQSSSSSTRVTTHQINLTGLSPNTTYHFEVRSETALGETATSAGYTFTTYASQVNPPDVTITNPDNGYGFLTKMIIHDEKIEINMDNDDSNGKNRLYIEDDDGVDQKLESKNIGSDNQTNFEVDPTNEFLKNDNNTFKGDKRKPNGNTSVKTPANVAFGSTAANDNISFEPRRVDRAPNMTNTTTNPKPTVGTYLPLSGVNCPDVTIQMWSKNVKQADYVLEGVAQITGCSAGTGMVSFRRTFFVDQPVGPVSVYFRLIDDAGIEHNRTDEFTLVYYKPCFVDFVGTVENDGASYQPILIGNSCIGWPVKVYIDDVFNGQFTPSENNFAYTPFVALAPGPHNVEFVTWEKDGLPAGKTSGDFDVSGESTAVGTPISVAPPAGPSETPEEVIEEEEVEAIEEAEEELDEAETEEELSIEEAEEAIEDLLAREDELTEEELKQLEEDIKKLNVRKWIEFGTEKLVELTPEEQAQLEKALQESLENGLVTITLRGVAFTGEMIDGVTKFCIKQCGRPSVLDDQNVIEVGGVLDIPETLNEKLAKAGAEAQVAANVGGAVQISKVNKTGEWTMTVPLSELPEGENEVVTKASMNGTTSDEVTVAKVQAQKEPNISNTSILIFVNVGLAIIFLAVGGVIYQRRKRTLPA